MAKTRYRQADQACSLSKTNNGYEVVFVESQRAVTPGQSVVFYQDDICLGGGVIEARYNVDSNLDTNAKHQRNPQEQANG